MTLRAINDSNNALSLMALLAILLPAGTQLAALSVNGDGSDRMYIEDRAAMISGSGFPACNLYSRQDTTTIHGGFEYEGQIVICVRYYDRWDTQPETIANIKKNILADLMRMAANIEDNNSLTYQGANHALSVPKMTVSEDFAIDEETSNIKLVYRELLLTINKYPYRA